MRRILTGVSTICLVCLATIMLVLIVQTKPLTPPAPQSPVVMISAVRARQSSVFEAIVDNSYEVFLYDDLTGQTRQLTRHFGNDRFPVLSPDGKQVAFVSWRDGDSEIYVLDLATGALRNLSNRPGQDTLLASAWSPDGTMLAYASRRDGQFDIALADVTRGLARNLTRSPYHDSQPLWLPNSQQVVFISDRGGGRAQYMIDLGGRNLTLYRNPNQWQAVQKTATLDVPLQTIPG